MKKSRRLIRNTLLVLGAAVVLYVAASRWHAVDNAQPVQNSPPTPAELAALRDFNSLVVTGNLMVEIVRQDGYSVEFIHGGGARTGSFTATIRAKALVVNGYRNSAGDRVRIGMPALSHVITDAVPVLSISGFSGNSISLRLDGPIDVDVHDNAVTQWQVFTSGGVVLKFDRASIGAGKIDLTGRASLTVID